MCSKNCCHCKSNKGIPSSMIVFAGLAVGGVMIWRMFKTDIIEALHLIFAATITITVIAILILINQFRHGCFRVRYMGDPRDRVKEVEPASESTGLLQVTPAMPRAIEPVPMVWPYKDPHKIIQMDPADVIER